VQEHLLGLAADGRRDRSTCATPPFDARMAAWWIRRSFAGVPAATPNDAITLRTRSVRFDPATTCARSNDVSIVRNPPLSGAPASDAPTSASVIDVNLNAAVAVPRVEATSPVARWK
jgi:hypothetical protein